MSVEIIDSFAHYAIGDVLLKGYSSIANPDAIVTGRFGASSKAMRFGAATRLSFRMPADQTTVITGFGFQMAGYPAGECEVISFQDAGVGSQIFLSITNSGILKLYRGSTVLATGSSLLPLNTWIHLAMKVFISPTVGTIEVRVNNVSMFAPLTGINTRNTANTRVNQVVWGFLGFNSGFGGSVYYSDLFLFNGAGSTCNDFPGDVAVSCLTMNGNGTTQNFSRSSGSSNVALINEATEDGDTTYVYSSNVGDIDTYTHTALSGAVSIYTSQVVAMARKDTSGSRHLGIETKSAGTNYVGAVDVSLGNSYQMVINNFEVDPATSAAWTQTNLNAAEFGVKIIS